jgi:hypothetical protein
MAAFDRVVGQSPAPAASLTQRTGSAMAKRAAAAMLLTFA